MVTKSVILVRSRVFTPQTSSTTASSLSSANPAEGMAWRWAVVPFPTLPVSSTPCPSQVEQVMPAGPAGSVVGKSGASWTFHYGRALHSSDALPGLNFWDLSFQEWRRSALSQEEVDTFTWQCATFSSGFILISFGSQS